MNRFATLARARALALILPFVLLVTCGAWPARAAEPAPARTDAPAGPMSGLTSNLTAILVLHSYHPSMRWTDEQRLGMDAVLGEARPPVDSFVEYLDAKRFPSAVIEGQFLALLRAKHERRTFAGALVTDVPALRFLVRHRRELLGNAPIFFSGINHEELPEFAGQPRISGVMEALDVGQTIELARRLQPAARRVYVIHDTSESGLANRRLVEKAAPAWAGRLEFEYAGSQSFATLFQRLSELPPDAFALNTGMSIDADGHPMRPWIRREFNRVCAVPIYSTSEDAFTEIGIAGSLISGREHGEMAAQMLLRHLGGVPLDQLQIVHEPRQHARADYLRLSRFNLDPNRLPPGTELLNQPYSYFDTYRWQILTAVSLILFLTVTVVLLLSDVRERHRAELRLSALTELGQHLSAASTLEAAARIIVESARKILLWDACSVDLCDPDTERVTPVLNLDTVNGQLVDVAPAYVGENASSMVHRVLTEGGVLIQRRGDEPAGDGLRPFGDKARRSASLMFVPIRAFKRTTGVLSIQSYTPEAYDERALHALQGLADLCGGAFERIRAQEHIHALNAELERRVLERTAELEAANKELEAFSYSVSHDLRAPLRHISGFAALLAERPVVAADDASKRHLQTIIQAASRLGLLIDDLLVFSRVGRAALTRVPIDTNNLVDSILREIQPDLAGRHITWRIGPLPQLHGDRAMLKLALHNLIANAVKYTARRAEAIIAIQGSSDRHETTLSIQDNGAGFDMRYAGKLFGVFQRLHSDKEFEGTGIGLANVQRIVHRHGGRVWAESQVDQGATFHLSLPSPPHPGTALPSTTASASGSGTPESGEPPFSLPPTPTKAGTPTKAAPAGL